MNVLLINKFHYRRGGAERNYFDTARLLAAQGHEVAFFSMHHPLNEPTPWSRFFAEHIDYRAPVSVFTKLRWAGRFIRNREAARQLERLLAEFKPDVAHLHNIYHQLTPSIISVLRRHNVPMVMTLHDYKLASPNYSLYANGRRYERGLRCWWRCAFDRCIDGSFAKSLLAVIEAYANRRAYRAVGHFIAPSRYLHDVMAQTGAVPAEKLVHLPYPLAVPPSAPSEPSANEIVYAGRLSPEKGVDILLRAWAASEARQTHTLVIAGTGPAQAGLQRLASDLGLEKQVIFTGHLSGAELQQRLERAAAIAVPSQWPENFPFAVLEAFALTKLLICSKIGGLSEMADNGNHAIIVSPYNDVSAWAQALDDVVNGAYDRQVPRKAHAWVTATCDPAQHYRQLQAVYREA